MRFYGKILVKAKYLIFAFAKTNIPQWADSIETTQLDVASTLIQVVSMSCASSIWESCLITSVCFGGEKQILKSHYSKITIKNARNVNYRRDTMGHFSDDL